MPCGLCLGALLSLVHLPSGVFGTKWLRFITLEPVCVALLKTKAGKGLNFISRSFYIWRLFLSAFENMKSTLRLVTLVFLVALPLIGGLFAQGGPPVGGPPPCWPPPCIPIDGSVWLLFVAGALLGGKQLMDLHRKRNVVRG